nr:MAG TPA: hypothetical protein [Caudoviricetes sp.]
METSAPNLIYNTSRVGGLYWYLFFNFILEQIL